MKTSKQIKAFILKRGNKLTNSEMVQKLEVPTMTFAGVLAGMKRKKEISNFFLKSDVENTKVKVGVSRTATVKASDLTPQLDKQLKKYNDSLVRGRRVYENEAFAHVIENQHMLLATDELSDESWAKLLAVEKSLKNCDYLEIV